MEYKNYQDVRKFYQSSQPQPKMISATSSNDEASFDSRSTVKSILKTKYTGSKTSAKFSSVTPKSLSKSRKKGRGKKLRAKPSFGSTSERFNVNTQHPGMWTQVTNKSFTKKFTGTNTENLLSPAYYNVKRLWEGEAGKANKSKRGWTRELDMERWSKLPSIFNRHIFEIKKEMQKHLGPGMYDVKYKLKKPESTRPLLNPHAERFQDTPPRFSTPGPGSYGKGGIPTPQLGKKCFGTKSFLANCVCRRDQAVECIAPPPNTYNLKDSLEEFLKKTTSKRGPYDLFTGKRDAPIKVGHRPTSVCSTSGLIYKPTETFVERLQNRRNKRKGRFFTAPQYPTHTGVRLCCSELPVPVQCAIKPSPAEYVGPAPFAGEVKEFKRRLLHKIRTKNPTFGFNSSTKRNTTFPRTHRRIPGPGRYNIPRFYQIEKKPKQSYTFATTTYKLEHSKHNLYLDRLRAKNVQVQNRCFSDIVRGIVFTLRL